eukprot:SAG31_NODE_2945_length_4874_cov_2.485864_4_plen_82_part_00
MCTRVPCDTMGIGLQQREAPEGAKHACVCARWCEARSMQGSSGRPTTMRMVGSDAAPGRARMLPSPGRKGSQRWVSLGSAR